MSNPKTITRDYVSDQVKRSLANFRHNLRLLRVDVNLSGVELAVKIGMAPKRINDLEEGRMPPKIEDAISIANVFNVTLSDLFSRIELNIPSKQNT